MVRTRRSRTLGRITVGTIAGIVATTLASLVVAGAAASHSHWRPGSLAELFFGVLFAVGGGILFLAERLRIVRDPFREADVLGLGDKREAPDPRG